MWAATTFIHTRCMVCCGRMGNWGSTYDMMNKWRMKSMGKRCMIGKGNWKPEIHGDQVE